LDFRTYGKAFICGPEFIPRSQVRPLEQARVGFDDWDNHSRDTLIFEGDIYVGETAAKPNEGSFKPVESYLRWV